MSDGLTVRSGGPHDTEELAAALVPLLRSGDIVLLSGELGAGKTAFTQGLARAAGVSEAVTSPTFTLIHSYPTAIGVDLLHVDVYRLETTTAVADLGLSELVEDDAFAVVEWGERAASVLGPEHLEITITVDPPAAEVDIPIRHIHLRPSGAAWRARWAQLDAAVRASSLGSAVSDEVTA